MDKLLKKEIVPPLIPKVMSPQDLSNFDNLITGEEVRESVLPEESLQKIDAKKDIFAKFAQTHDS